MKKTQENLILLNCIFVMSLLVANIVAGKIVSIFGFIVPAAVVAYAVTFLCTDVIGEIWGKKEANRTVRVGFIVQSISLFLIFLALQLPSAPFAVEFGVKFQEVLGQGARVVLASLTAYLISQANDVLVFHRLKAVHGGSHKWIRNNVSTLTSQLIDTAIFITVAFYGIVPNLTWMIVSQYVVKAVLAVLDTPFFYLLTKEELVCSE